MKTKLKLVRAYLGTDGTIGTIGLNDSPPKWTTIERPWMMNRKFISCIPEGTWPMKPFSSEKHPDTYEIIVPDRDAILFHVANTMYDVEGCVGIGAGFGTLPRGDELLPAVVSSKVGLAHFLKTLEKFKDTEMEITVVNA